ncbi:Sec-independent protein translocase protein TatB [Sphingomonas sp. BGYR3]|uniref:Sec-independent protein translocase protein TatB n=1 Tax=Sphingomonas sp. BGYR3 TaxID=2975483 RepID=UPI0021A669FA|nr:Sec-independent protein translocase protein TatB [Sphingomonas sp. BGYR3]MDG5488130.1 Sec-independent protein translocase protein TatB [Sphingomonas sp. BGYR3]
MFDVAPTELMLVAIVALLVIGPKDLPKAMRFVGQWVGKARAVTRQFRAGFDNMVREAELAEMEKKWAEENARIMREFPSVDALPAPHRPEADGTAAAEPVVDPYADAPALQTPRPDIVDSTPDARDPASSAPADQPAPAVPPAPDAPRP